VLWLRIVRGDLNVDLLLFVPSCLLINLNLMFSISQHFIEKYLLKNIYMHLKFIYLILICGILVVYQITVYRVVINSYKHN
jgi:hypothetical protein